MATVDYTDKGAIRKYGGGILKIRPVSDVGVYSSGDTYVLGYLQDTTLRYEKPVEDIVDETGNTVASLPGSATVKLTGMLMQSNMTLLDFLRDSTESLYYQLYYKMSPTGDFNSLTQELFGGICVIKPMLEVKAGAKRIPFEITFLKNDSAITISTPDSVFGSVETDTVTIAAGKYYEITEN